MGRIPLTSAGKKYKTFSKNYKNLTPNSAISKNAFHFSLWCDFVINKAKIPEGSTELICG